MAKSVFRKSSYIGFVVLTILAFVCLFMIYAMLSIHFFKSELVKTALTKGESVIVICIFALLAIFIIRILMVHPVNISIDVNKKEIVFGHILFSLKRSYSFSDFDYFIETVEHSIGGSSKAIYLIKNNKLKKAIRGYYYLNIDEMQEVLKSIPDHGFKKLSRLRVILLYFRKNL